MPIAVIVWEIANKNVNILSIDKLKRYFFINWLVVNAFALEIV